MLNITIANLERNVADGGVTVAHWRASLTQDEVSASSYGTVSFTPDPEAEGFTAFESLTEEDVCGWVCAELDLVSMEASLQAKIDEHLAPVSVSGLPW